MKKSAKKLSWMEEMNERIKYTHPHAKLVKRENLIYLEFLGKHAMDIKSLGPVYLNNLEILLETSKKLSYIIHD